MYQTLFDYWFAKVVKQDGPFYTHMGNKESIVRVAFEAGRQVGLSEAADICDKVTEEYLHGKIATTCSIFTCNDISTGRIRRLIQHD